MNPEPVKGQLLAKKKNCNPIISLLADSSESPSPIRTLSTKKLNNRQMVKELKK